jgi:beta-hydroxylase
MGAPALPVSAMVMRLFAPQFLILWAFVGSAIAMHLRGKVRPGFWRQVSDHSRLMAPYNVPMYLFSALPNPMIPELAVPRDNLGDDPRGGRALFARDKIKAANKYTDITTVSDLSRSAAF